MMRPDSKAMLRQLGAGESIASVAETAGLTRAAFDAWWREETRARAPRTSGRRLPGGDRAAIGRDGWGVPHIGAASDESLLVAFGYAMGQDRLFQLDYLRRKAIGRLAEVLGPEGLEADTVARTVGFSRIAAAEWAAIPGETGALLLAFARGVNAAMEDARGRWPIEFDLLDYEPAPWQPADSLAIAVEFRYYLTVRFPVIVLPELAARALGPGPRYEAFLQAEADDESILPAGPYPARGDGVEAAGAARGRLAGWSAGDPEEGRGSNNWAVAGVRTVSGKPLVASDPHIAFAAVSCWYEAHLHGPTFNAAGAAYAGIPGLMFGRNEQVAWGVTNNICSQRDLYQERTDPAHPGAFLHDGRWEPAQERVEEIAVRGQPPVRKTIRSSRNGPIVDEILPAPARATGPVALRWLGATAGEWVTALTAMSRARSATEFREALRGWCVPTLSFVFADVEGHIGYQAAGRIPIRAVRARGYRPGWEPAHQWQGVVPFEGMPAVADPPRGFVATANNRPAPDDYPYPLAGTWSSGHRARRVRQMLEDSSRLTREDVARMHQDVLSLRAMEGVPRLLKALSPVAAADGDPRIAEAARHLEVWDGRMEVDRVGATIFDAFFVRWGRAVAAERFRGDAVPLLADASAGLAASLLADDPSGWFAPGRREAALVLAMRQTLAELTDRLGPDMATWTWGRLHRIHLRHVLSGRGDLGTLLDRGGMPVPGNGVTLCNTGYDPNYLAPIGANYRLIADLATSGLLAVDAQGVSGHPGSPHYGDQLAEWLAGRYHYLPLDPADTAAAVAETLTLEPAD